MFPTIIEIGWFKVHSYGLCIAIAFLVCLYLTMRDAKKKGIDPEAIENEAIFALLAGIIGSRIFHIILFPHEYSITDPIGWVAIWQGGLVFQGALPFAFAYVIWAMRRRKISFLLVADCAVPYLALGQGIGRIGCFLNGCCYGKPTTCFLGMSFPEGCPVFQSYPGNNGWSLPVHPTQLYTTAGLFLLCVLLIYLRNNWSPFIGFTIPAYFFLHGFLRFLNEFFRGDHNPTGLGFGILSDQQIFCILEVLLGILLFWGMNTYYKIQKISMESSQTARKKKK